MSLVKHQFFETLLNEQIESFLFKISRDFPDQAESIMKLLNKYKIEFSTKGEKSKGVTCNKCQARSLKNGEEGQCKFPAKCGTNLCGRHQSKLIYGLITEPIPDRYANKFTKRLKSESEIQPYSNNNSLILSCSYKPINNISIQMIPSSKSNLDEVEINGDSFYYDKVSNLLYTYEENPKYIGTFMDDFIIRI